MSDQDPPVGDSGPQNPLNIPLDVDKVRQRAESVYADAPPEVKQAVQQSKSFYEEHKQVIHGVVIGVVALKFYKRRVAKASAKAVVRALAEKGAVAPNGTTLPTLFDVLQSLRDNPMMAYIPHGGGMVHMLGGKDVIVTVFGEFEKMTNDQVWAAAAKKLGMLSNSPQVVGR